MLGTTKQIGDFTKSLSTIFPLSNYWSLSKHLFAFECLCLMWVRVRERTVASCLACEATSPMSAGFKMLTLLPYEMICLLRWERTSCSFPEKVEKFKNWKKWKKLESIVYWLCIYFFEASVVFWFVCLLLLPALFVRLLRHESTPFFR